MAILGATARRLKCFFVVACLLYSALILSQLLIQRRYIKERTFLKSNSRSTVVVNTSSTKIPIIKTEWVQQPKMSLCSDKPSSLVGRRDFNFNNSAALNHTENEDLQIDIGGSWSPKDCIPIKKVAILVPYRKRPQQLNTFLTHIHPILQRQRLDYRIFVIEQAGTTTFNKGAIYNIGFNQSLSYDGYDCYIFHDVDLLCENDLNYYGCPASPMHMSPSIDKFDYKLPYTKLFGGIQAFTKEDYVKINGYTNIYWGWGAEDDNLYSRIVGKGLKLKRPSMEIGRFKMNKEHHFRSDGWSAENIKLYVNKISKQDVDGLNSIHKLKFTIQERLEPLFTLISINLQR
eukprot:gene824-10566_t